MSISRVSYPELTIVYLSVPIFVDSFDHFINFFVGYLQRYLIMVSLMFNTHEKWECILKFLILFREDELTQTLIHPLWCNLQNKVNWMFLTVSIKSFYPRYLCWRLWKSPWAHFLCQNPGSFCTSGYKIPEIQRIRSHPHQPIYKTANSNILFEGQRIHLPSIFNYPYLKGCMCVCLSGVTC